MTTSALTTAARHALSGAGSALAQFHPETRVDPRCELQSSNADQRLIGKKTNRAVPAPREFAFGSFRVLPTQFLLLEGDKPVPIGSRALEILMVLLDRPGGLISKQELMGRVWPNIFVEPANLTVHISALRRVLRDGRNGNRFIINIPGRGYCFVAPVVLSGRVESDGNENHAALREQPSARCAAWSDLGSAAVKLSCKSSVFGSMVASEGSASIENVR